MIEYYTYIILIIIKHRLIENEVIFSKKENSNKKRVKREKNQEKLFYQKQARNQPTKEKYI